MRSESEHDVPGRSYAWLERELREKSLGRDLNPGSRPYQGRALPLSYPGRRSKVAGCACYPFRFSAQKSPNRTGFEPDSDESSWGSNPELRPSSPIGRRGYALAYAREFVPSDEDREVVGHRRGKGLLGRRELVVYGRGEVGGER